MDKIIWEYKASSIELPWDFYPVTMLGLPAIVGPYEATTEADGRIRIRATFYFEGQVSLPELETKLMEVNEQRGEEFWIVSRGEIMRIKIVYKTERISIPADPQRIVSSMGLELKWDPQVTVDPCFPLSTVRGSHMVTLVVEAGEGVRFEWSGLRDNLSEACTNVGAEFISVSIV